MDFDDLFKHGNKHHQQGSGHHSGHDGYYDTSHSHNRHNEMSQLFFEKLRNNPKLKILLLIAAIVVVAVVIMAVVLLLPLLLKLISYLSENGINGIINAIWNGTK